MTLSTQVGQVSQHGRREGDCVEFDCVILIVQIPDKTDRVEQSHFLNADHHFVRSGMAKKLCNRHKQERHEIQAHREQVFSVRHGQAVRVGNERLLFDFFKVWEHLCEVGHFSHTSRNWLMQILYTDWCKFYILVV